MADLYIYFPAVTLVVFLILLVVSFYVKCKKYSYKVEAHEVFSDAEIVIMITISILIGVVISLTIAKTL